MHFSIPSILIPFLFIVTSAIASPIEDRSIETRAIKPIVVPGAGLVAHPDISLPKFKVPLVASTTSPNTGFGPLSVALADSVVLCAPHDCTSCVAYALSGLATDVCYTPPSAFFSGFLYTASGASPGYNLYISTTTTKCGSAQLFSLDVCTNVANNISGFDFFLL